jgi:hypothetical protein
LYPLASHVGFIPVPVSLSWERAIAPRMTYQMPDTDTDRRSGVLRCPPLGISVRDAPFHPELIIRTDSVVCLSGYAGLAHALTRGGGVEISEQVSGFSVVVCNFDAPERVWLSYDITRKLRCVVLRERIFPES